MKINYDQCAMALFYIKSLILKLETDIVFKSYTDNNNFFLLDDISHDLDWASHFIENTFGEISEKITSTECYYLKSVIGNTFCSLYCKEAICNLKTAILFIEMDVLYSENKIKNGYAGMEFILGELENAHMNIEKAYFMKEDNKEN